MAMGSVTDSGIFSQILICMSSFIFLLFTLSLSKWNSYPDVLGMQFTWDGYFKQVGSSIIGCSPEFDLAVYSLCYITRPGKQWVLHSCVCVWFIPFSWSTKGDAHTSIAIAVLHFHPFWNVCHMIAHYVSVCLLPLYVMFSSGFLCAGVNWALEGSHWWSRPTPGINPPMGMGRSTSAPPSLSCPKTEAHSSHSAFNKLAIVYQSHPASNSTMSNLSPDT